jgi:nitrate/TMAO reductase-like tetraheme cytochrome c subunit
VVCHAEGDAVTGDADGTYHQKDGVQLKDTDSGVAYSDWSGLTAAQRSDFCMSCHDTDGATIITTRTDPDPDATTDALNPFNDGVTNAHEGDAFGRFCTDETTPCTKNGDCSGSDICEPALTAPHPRGRCSVTSVIACGTGYECPTGETCEFLKVVDVFSQFDTANTSHHAVRGQAYGSAAPFGTNVDNAIQGVRTDLAWNSVIDCEDCHYGTATTKLSAHGTANARYMLRDKDGNDTLPAPLSAGNNNVNCFRCHISTGDPGSYTESLSAFAEHNQGAHIDDTLNLFGISCLNCHGGAEFGAIHGVDGLVTDDEGGGSYEPNVFTWGSSLDLMSNWTSGVAFTCSARDDKTLLNDCTQHSAKGGSRAATQDRTYRAP